ncbi:hypothetical protein KPL76_06340 [Subtercola sp. PAMC28395]|uniref:hypothetical protein n=1 Tax=Subtercola sp. PAMC28395 TaxID=2846775 RepID=UPI001C0AE6DE|nr:hypothetical protein [Subtercola sp. PAMC28395]QWT24972.1 hypothetical protein KPL76_06340 [Subtercola sp. PAMC28395]
MTAFQDTIIRVYREQVGTYGPAGVNRQEAIESALSILHAEISSGRIQLDQDAALRAFLMNADERDGRNGDAILKRAARGEVPLTLADLDIVVTLGGGHRKQWADVMLEDLNAMNDIRFRNFKAARDSYADFNSSVLAVRPVLFQYGTFGGAFKNGGFPPQTAASAAA